VSLAAIVSMFLAFAFLSTACNRSIEFHIHPSTLECGETSCQLTFDVESLTESVLLLRYEATLTQNYVNDPNKTGIVNVGVSEDEFSLSPHERKTISCNITVDEQPNGSRVSIEIAAR